jgi:hypothetical protein
MWHGMLLFLLGLITGLLEQRFTNVRMGLSAHLEPLSSVAPERWSVATARASVEVWINPV